MIEEPKVSITESPEFKTAVAAQRAELQAEMQSFKDEVLKGIQVAVAQAPAPDSPKQAMDLETILSTLALRIGEVSDQGTQRKRVPPEELAERYKAFERMGELIAKAQGTAQKEWPRYGLKAKVEMNSRIIDPFRRNAKNEIEPVEILHIGMPNVAMRPINAAAKAIFSEYVRYLGGSKEANQVAAPQPMWMTTKGTLIAGPAPNTVKNIGNEFTPDPIVIDDEEGFVNTMPGSQGPKSIVSTTDPRATEIPVLGTLAEPARVGSVSPRLA